MAEFNLIVTYANSNVQANMSVLSHSFNDIDPAMDFYQFLVMHSKTITVDIRNNAGDCVARYSKAAKYGLQR